MYRQKDVFEGTSKLRVPGGSLVVDVTSDTDMRALTNSRWAKRRCEGAPGLHSVPFRSFINP